MIIYAEEQQPGEQERRVLMFGLQASVPDPIIEWEKYFACVCV